MLYTKKFRASFYLASKRRAPICLIFCKREQKSIQLKSSTKLRRLYMRTSSRMDSALFKDTGQIGRSNPDSIVLHDKDNLILPFMSRNAENRLLRTILDRIDNQLI